MASPQEIIFEDKVYLAFKDIFTGQRAEFRKAKAVLRIVNKYRNHSPVSSLLKTASQQAVCESLCRLLKEGVFQSEGPAPVVPESPASELTFLRAPNSEPGTCSKMIHGAVPESEPDSMEEYGGK